MGGHLAKGAASSGTAAERAEVLPVRFRVLNVDVGATQHGDGRADLSGEALHAEFGVAFLTDPGGCSTCVWLRAP